MQVKLKTNSYKQKLGYKGLENMNCEVKRMQTYNSCRVNIVGDNDSDEVKRIRRKTPTMEGFHSCPKIT